MRRLSLIVLLATALTARPAPLDEPPDEPLEEDAPTLVDRVVAVVDDEPILHSDLRRVIGLGLVERRPDESERELERRVLDGLIDQRLRLHEVERHDFGPLPPEEVDRQVERLRANFDDDQDFQRTLERLGLDAKGLRLLLARQLRVLVYVEKRLGPRVFVNADDVDAYYRDVLAPEMRRRGVEPPALDDVRGQIREVLREEKLNGLIATWTEELRREADVADHFDRPEAELPPVVKRLEGGGRP